MESHGHKKHYKATATYDAWSHMCQRCKNPKNKEYDNYGGRKIQICRRWENFVNFLEDMGNRPTTKHSLDRIDNNRGYNKKNCRWATKKEQAYNRRDNRLETYNGLTQCVAVWAEKYGLPYYTFLWRLNHGWSIHKALTETIRGSKNGT